MKKVTMQERFFKEMAKNSELKVRECTDELIKFIQKEISIVKMEGK